MDTDLRTDGRLRPTAGFVVGGLLAMAVLAANSLGTYAIAGSELTGMKGWPEPIGWIARMLVLESWPTFRGIEIRWLAWAVGAACLMGLAMATGGLARGSTAKVAMPRCQAGAPDGGRARQVFALLVGMSVILAVLVGVRAGLSAVQMVGWMWTWQLGLALVWMLALYVWAVRLSARTLVRALAVALSVLCGISLLYCIQGRQSYPNWPNGNVLLLTTGGLAGIFLLGTWAYGVWVTALKTGEMRDYLAAVGISGVFAMVAVVLSMAGRRAGVLGLVVGAVFVAVMTLSRRVDLREAGSPRAGWRMWAVIWGGLVVAVAGGAVTVPRLLTSGRWETVVYRVEMYKAAGSVLKGSPGIVLSGVGPGQLGFDLTALMRPLHAESPRLFHGEVADAVHSEPLQAIVELGVPVGLLYLALPLGGLIGFARAYRRATDLSGRLAMLGAGAALAASLAAEATSVGMRYPDVAIVVWALVGIGWACGARADGFAWVHRVVRWSSIADRVGQRVVIWRAIGVIASLLVLVLAWRSVQASADLYRAQQAWTADRFVGAEAILSGRRPCVPAAEEWMAWKYLQGRAELAIAAQAQTEKAAAPWRDKGLDALGALVAVCPAYQDAPVWLGKGTGNWEQAKAFCESFLRYDPYDCQGRLVLASLPGVSAVEQLRELRMSMRNAEITSSLVTRIVQVVQDADAARQLATWVADAECALQRPKASAWRDPLALESLRLAVVVAGQQGNVTEALQRANQAEALTKYLSADARRNRPEAVEMEVYLDQAWFGWLERPDGARSCVGVLEGHLRDLVHGPASSYSEKMAAEFVGMLRLGQDRQSEALRWLYTAASNSSKGALRRMAGLGYARLITMVGQRASAEQLQKWETEGKQAMGDGLWGKTLEAAEACKDAAWWFGVLSE